MRNSFRPYERLKREQHIDTLFRTGKAFSVLPVKLIYHSVPRGAELSPARAGFSVPKKKFRKAVQRNRIKRLMREAWRLNKHLLYAAVPETTQLHIFLIFTGTEQTVDAIAESIVKGIARLEKEVAAKS